MNNPFDYTPDAMCDEAFGKLTQHIETLRQSLNPADINFCRELDAGKMLGVLIAEDRCGSTHTLYAFSGQLGFSGFHHEGFVGPVLDYLRPDGYFKTKEKDISRQTMEISRFETGTLADIRKEYIRAEKIIADEISGFKEKCRQAKQVRDQRRKEGVTDDSELADMIRRSQFEKAELHRLRKRGACRLEPYAVRLKEGETHLEKLKEKRRSDSENLQKWLFSNFILINARGERRSVGDIFADTPMKTPPSGAGECCAPKLLQEAFVRGWRPLAIAEYWFGKSDENGLRIHGVHYPACRGKCLPLLRWMLQGLDVHPQLTDETHSHETFSPEIMFENECFCVINKPSGMLSVPGKSPAISIEQWLKDKYGPDRFVKMAHRLDRDTSGLIIATFSEQSYKVIQSLFATRQIKKTYVALLEGDYRLRGIPRSGHISLPLSPDFLDRPRQRIDFSGGKTAETDYEFIGSPATGVSRVIFHPLTGRTHQLRVHAASEKGLGMPIAGDPIYGKRKSGQYSRLHLHAHKIEFTFPIDGHSYTFESPTPF